MESAVGLGDKRVGREEGEDLGFGFASNAVPFQKLSRTAAFPSRMVVPPGGDFYDGLQQQTVPTSFKSSGVGMGDNGGAAAVPMRAFPFTWAQWQELQRQALIYKHIMASVPVPPDLLFPIAARYFPSLPPSLVGGGGGSGAGFNLRFSNGTDPEPGRCRRTDGKKWRCSRDAAPDQKYCERHLHRGRPRSRKPVELRKTKPSPTTNSPSPSTTPSKFPFQSNKEPRYSDEMEGMASNQQWELNQQINLNYADLKHHCFPFLNPDLSSLENERDPPRRFIDAWSAENVAAASNPNDSSSGPTGDKPGLSTLTLSVSTGGFEEGTDHIRMGLGLVSDAGLKSHSSLNWMSSPSPLGGPLAEVLQSSNNSKSSGVDLINLMGKGGCCRSATDHEVVSPQDSPSRLASSPSGVLQKALVSLSDSSSSSSPTFAAASRAEVAFQWMNHGS